MLYDDGRIACDETGVIISWYYPWGERRVEYASIVGVTERQMGILSGRWRIWGGGLLHWYNLDVSRPKKVVALDLDVGARVRPTITPDDSGMVLQIIRDHSSL